MFFGREKSNSFMYCRPHMRVRTTGEGRCKITPIICGRLLCHVPNLPLEKALVLGKSILAVASAEVAWAQVVSVPGPLWVGLRE